LPCFITRLIDSISSAISVCFPRDQTQIMHIGHTKKKSNTTSYGSNDTNNKPE